MIDELLKHLETNELTSEMLENLKKMFGSTIFEDGPRNQPIKTIKALASEEPVDNPWDPAPKDDGIVMFTEFPSEAKPEYPYNYVTTTPAGHQTEFDNTPSHERIRFRHAEGSYWEMMADGRETKKTNGIFQHFVGEDRELLTQGDSKEQVSGERIRLISGSDTDTVAGNRTTKIDGSQSEIIGQHREVSILGNDTLTVDGDGTIIVKGNVKIIVQGDADLSVEGNCKASVAGNMEQTVGGNYDMTATGNVTMKAGGNFAIDGQRIDLG